MDSDGPTQADAYVIEGNRDALDRLTWIYLKLLVARDHLEATRKQVSQADLERRIDQREGALADPAQTSGSLRESQQATLKLLQQRLLNLARSRRTLEEVASDLERIEAQVDLVLDSAGLHGPAEVLPGTIELASQLLVGEGDYGESGAAVSALDEVYRARGAAAQKQSA